MATKKNSSRTGTNDGRARNFATVVYPESAPDNWLNILADSKVPIFVSPFHDRDINPDGTPKKPHYHVITMYEGKKNPDTVAEFFKSFGGVGIEVISSIRGYARYLCHKDNPEKAQYSEEEVKAFGGADYSSVCGLPTDKYKAIGEMMEFCEKEDIYLYADLLIYAKIHRYDWFRVLCDNGTMVIKEYLTSREYGKKHPALSVYAKGTLEEKSAEATVNEDGVITGGTTDD